MKNETKYHNVKTRGYDSAKEAERARELHLLEKAGKIRDMREQVKFELIPAQYENDNPRVARGRCLERACNYVADFTYVNCATGETVVEDAKGVRTKEYVIKRKLMLWVHGIRIKEV